jgi:hypothetical protein
MVSMRPRKQLWRIQLDCEILIKTYIIFPRQGSFQHKTMFKTVCLWRDCRSGFSGINETAEADSAVSMRQRKRLLLSQQNVAKNSVVPTFGTLRQDQTIFSTFRTQSTPTDDH